MGDILGSIFGTSSSTEQETVPDAVARALNTLRYSELSNLFTRGSLNQFSEVNPGGIYDLTNESNDLLQGGVRNAIDNLRNVNYDNLLSLDDYRRSFDTTTDAYNNASNRLNQTTDEALGANTGQYNQTSQYLSGLTSNALARSYADYGNTRADADVTYQRGSADVEAAYNAAIARGDFDLARSLITNEGYANRAVGNIEGNFQRGLAENRANATGTLNLAGTTAERALSENEQNYIRALNIAGNTTRGSLDLQDRNRARALELGLNTTGNYIDQIATPRLNAALALQGLESSGAVPAAIARATAETAMPYLQSIENTYGTNQANTVNRLLEIQAALGSDVMKLDNATLSQLTGIQGDVGKMLMELQGALTEQNLTSQAGVNSQLLAQQGAATESAASGNRALSGQRMAVQGDLAGNYQNNVNQLAQALMANNVSLEQAGIDAQSALGGQLMQAQTALRTQQQQGITSLANTYGTNAANFAQSLPGASQTLSMLPGQVEALRAGTLSALQPLADYPRQLREADYLRRQGLFTTAYTGIPYTPGSTTYGGSATGNIFDQLGGTIQSGLTGGGNIGGANT